MGQELNRRWWGTARARAAAGLVLLVLTAHAFVASATHFHRPARAAAANSAQAALLSPEEGGQNAPLAGDEAQCLLCRLQRNFVSGVRHAVPAVVPLPADALSYQPFPNISARAACSLLRQGRAPPHA